MIRKILLVGPRLKTGGISRFVTDLLNADIGYHMCFFDVSRPAKPETSKGALGYRTLFAAGVLWAIRNVVLTGWNITRFPFALLLSRARIVHVATSSHWTFWESSVYLFVAKLLGRKVILHFLSDFQRFYGSARTREKIMIQSVFKVADRVVVLSDSVRQTVAPFRVKQDVVVVPSSVDLTGCSADETRMHRVTDKAVVLFMGGNYGVRKGVYDLIQAIPRVVAECRDVVFWLGGGKDVEAACNCIKDGLRDAVTYLGWADEITKSRLLSTASVYVLPSYSEGLPYGVIEAMAFGLPVIATTVGSIPEVVIDGENGFLFSPGDVDALVNSIIRLVRNLKIIHIMGATNRKKAQRLFSSVQAFETIRTTYNSVLGIHP